MPNNLKLTVPESVEQKAYKYDKISEEDLELLKELATESPPPMDFYRAKEFTSLPEFIIKNKELEKIIEEIAQIIKEYNNE